MLKNLTDRVVMALKVDFGNPYEVFVSRINGFSVEVNPSGGKNYFLKYYVAGKKRELRLVKLD